MSGIEIFGGVSAGIQLVESIQKLRALCSSVKNAPSTLHDLIFDLETMALCLDQLERSQNARNPLLLQRCLDRCRVSTSRIQVIVDKIQSIGVRNAFVSKLYTALKDPDISKLFVELEQAKSTLSLSLISYNSREQTTVQNAQLARMERQSVQLDLIWTQMRLRTEAMAQMSHRPVPPRSILHGYNRVPESSLELYAPGVRQKGTTWSKKARNKQFTIRLPQWLSSRVWRVCITQARSGWDLNLRTSTPRDPLSEVFFRCVKGDVKAVQKMIAEGHASLFDYSADVVRSNASSSVELYGEGRNPRQEFNLLLTAVYHGQEELFEWLFRELGYRRIDFNHLAFIGSWMVSKRFDSILTTFLDKSAEIMDLDFTLPENCLFVRLMTEHQLEAVLSRTDLLQSGLTALEMFEYISNRRYRGYGIRFISAGMFLKLTGLVSSSPHLATLKARTDQFSILHLVAVMVANVMRESADYDQIRDWMSIAHSALANGMPPSGVAVTKQNEQTALLYLVDELYLYVQDDNPASDHASALVRIWLQTVQDAGIDLAKYGTAERELWRSSKRFHLGYIDSPDEWSLFVSTRTTEIPLYRAWRMPGSFPPSPYMPEYISWYPEDCDRDVYYWQGIKSMTILRAWRDAFAIDVNDNPDNDLDEHPDDASSSSKTPSRDAIHFSVLLNSRSPRHYPLRRRSASVPAPRRSRYNPNTRESIPMPSWRSGVHFCVMTMRYESCYASWPQERICANGKCYLNRKSDTAQASGGWCENSFLADIRDCLDGFINPQHAYRRPSMWVHTGRKDCPWGCGKVDWDRLHVPEDLMPGHPRRAASERWDQL